jgi:putative inorganic carbon (HCO3(-)) transporter
MRDYLIFAFVFGALPFVFKRPALGALLFTWFSLMNPHRLAYGAAYDFPFAAVIAVFTLLSMVVSRQTKRFPVTPVTTTLLIFAAWMTLTSFFALEPLLVWREWDRVIKTLLMVVVTLTVLNTEKHIKQLVWVLVLSLGLYGLKGGIFTILSGGQFRVYGPEGSYIAENNSMALAMVTVLPFVWYLRSQATNKWVKLGLTVMGICTAISAMGSYSRGAFIGGAVMLFFMWVKSPKKVKSALVLVAVVAVIAIVMPAQWFDRIDSINEFKQDGSVLGRFNAWQFAINVATQNLLGGGFNVFSARMFMLYAPEPLNYHVAHSIYFQVLGDHGFVGILIFLLLMLFSWRTGTRIIKFCGNDPALAWASNLAKMCQVSIIGFAVSGAFLSLAYFDLYYDIIVIVVLLEKMLMLQRKAAQRQVGRQSLIVTKSPVHPTSTPNLPPHR